MRTKKHFVLLLLLAVSVAAGLIWSSGTRLPSSESIQTPQPGTYSSSSAGVRSQSLRSPIKKAIEAPKEIKLAHIDDTVARSLPQVQDKLVVWGTIETNFGEVAEGETIELYSGSLKERYVAISDEQGGFVFSDVRPASDYRLDVSPRGIFKHYQRRNLEISTTETILRIVLEPLRVGLLRGQIVNAQGQPVPNLDISLRSLSKDRGIVNARSDAVGLFEIEGFPEGPIEVFSRDVLLRIEGLRFGVDANEVLTLVVDHGRHQLSGRVYDRHGQPLVGAAVLLNWTHWQGEARSVVERRTITDSLGAFTMDDLGEGQHDLLLSLMNAPGLRRIVNIGVDPSEMALYLENVEENDTY